MKSSSTKFNFPMDNNRPDNHSIYNEEVDLSKQSHNILVCIIQELGYRLFLWTVNCDLQAADAGEDALPSAAEASHHMMGGGA